MDVHVKPIISRRTGNHTTIANPYAIVPDDVTSQEYFLVKGYSGKIVSLVCTLNDLDYKAEASIDGTTWHPIVTETLIAQDAIAYFTNTENWERLRVQVKPNVGAAHGDLAVTIGLSSI